MLSSEFNAHEMFEKDLKAGVVGHISDDEMIAFHKDETMR